MEIKRRYGVTILPVTAHDSETAEPTFKTNEVELI